MFQINQQSVTDRNSYLENYFFWIVVNKKNPLSYRSMDTQTHRSRHAGKSIDTQIYTGTQICRYANPWRRRSTGTQAHRRRNTQFHRYLDTRIKDSCNRLDTWKPYILRANYQKEFDILAGIYLLPATLTRVMSWSLFFALAFHSPCEDFYKFRIGHNSFS